MFISKVEPCPKCQNPTVMRVGSYEKVGYCTKCKNRVTVPIDTELHLLKKLAEKGK